MCVLRVTSNRKTLTDFLSASRIPFYEAHDKNTLQRLGRNKGKPFGYAGFQSDVSAREWDDLPGQVSDAVRFLRSYKADLKLLRQRFKVRDLRLDFPYYLCVCRNNIAVQCDLLPPVLIALAGELEIGIEMTVYPPPRAHKRTKKSRTRPSTEPPPSRSATSSGTPERRRSVS
jgi:hypothetical protein